VNGGKKNEEMPMSGFGKPRKMWHASMANNFQLDTSLWPQVIGV